MRGPFGQIGGALALAASVILGIAGCGDGDAGELASLAPPDAPLYAEFVVRPEGEQEEAVRSLVERLGGIDDPGAELAATLDALFADDGLDYTYADDVEPWLGERAAVFVRSFEPSPVAGGVPDFAVLADTTDPEAAQAFIERLAEADPAPQQPRSYGGFEYHFSPDDGGVAVGLIDDALVLGTEMSFRVAVDASEGESLAESEDYATRTEALGDDLLATVSLEPAAVIEAGTASEDIDPAAAQLLRPLLGGPLAEPVAIGLSATPDSASLDFVAMVDDDRELATDASLLERLPAGSWLAAAMPDLGLTMERTLDQIANSGIPGGSSILEGIRHETGIDLRSDLLGWLGDAAGFVRGTAVPGFTAGVVAETTDPQGPRRLLDTVRTLAERDSGLRSSGPPEGAEYGFSLGVPGLGGGAEAAIVGDQVVVVVGGTVEAVLDPVRTLGEDDRFDAAVGALGDDFPAALYLHLPTLLEVAEKGGSATDPDYRAAAPYLVELESLAAGSRLTDGLGVTRITVALGE